MTEEMKDITTCAITNGPKGLRLDWMIHQDLDGEDWRFLCFSLDLDELYSVIKLIDMVGFLWASCDRGETWVKTDDQRLAS